MKYVSVLLILSVCCYPSFAQQTRFINDPQIAFNQAKEFFQKEQYSLAYPILKELELNQRVPDRSSDALNYQEVRYYTIVCALDQNEEKAAADARKFIELEDNATRVQMMSFHLGEYYYRKHDFSQAINSYENTNIDNLSNPEIAQMKFHLGYSYFTVKRFEQAKSLLDAIRKMPRDPNYQDANYYFGFIAFYDKDYRNALDAFRVVENHENYGKVVPYYISTIQYALNQQDKAVDYAESKLNTGKQTYDLEMRQLVGHSYFQKKDYGKAVPFLEAYVINSPRVGRQDLYELSYSFYQLGNYQKAIDGFKQLGGKQDSLSQNSMYLLGDAYLKTDQRVNARNAFLFCSINSSNDQQREISMFNYAKLSYELGYQDVALSEFQKFIQRYPNSKYGTEARDLLIAVLANTSNYQDALVLIEGMKNPSPAAKQLYPKILYGRATELINDGLLLPARELLNKAERDPANASVLPYVQFWKGEIAYRLNNTDEAIKYYFDYLKAGVSNGEVNPAAAKYNLGYSFIKKENYTQAAGFFDQLVTTPQVNSPPLEQDAYLRSADCAYMNKDYTKADEMYTKVLDFSWPSSDYATFQKAMIAGVKSSTNKINLLTTLTRKYTSSPLLADANMEIANALLADELYKEAIPYLKNVIADPNASLKPKSQLRLGIAYYNLNNNKEALNQYTSLLKQFPNSPEAESALENAKTIYVDEGRTAEYVNFARSMGKEVTTTQEEELAYQEAEVQFNNGNLPAAAKKFEDYLAKYPIGKNSLEALYLKSDIYYNRKEWEKAEQGYEILSERVPHKYGEKSLLLAARINFFDLKKYDSAEKYYLKLKDFASTQESRLEAMRGLLRSQFQLEKWSDAVENAEDLLAQKSAGTDDKILANIAIARSAQENQKYESAITAYRTVASLSKSAYGAEARYEIARCYFLQNRYDDAEKAAFEVIKKTGSYEIWVTKAYLLLGDVYYAEKDYFNAKATYRSVVQNARSPEVREEAETKLNKVTEEEIGKSKLIQ